MPRDPLAMWFDWLLGTAGQNLLTTSLLVPVVLLLCRAFPSRPAVQHGLWLLVLLKFLTPPVPGFAWTIPAPFASLRGSPVQVDEDAAMVERGSPSEDRVRHSSASRAGGVSAPAADVPRTRLDSYPSARTVLLGAAAIIWAAGAARVLTTYFAGLRRQGRLLRRATPADARLTKFVAQVAAKIGVLRLATVVSAEVRSPCISCMRGVRLVWPEHLAGTGLESLRSLVAHEAAHVRRHDHVVAWLELIVTVVWWWNPVLWFVRRQLRCAAEVACDALALDAFPEDRCLYAEQLLKLSVSSVTPASPLTLAVGADAFSTLERRISMIASERACGTSSRGGLVAALLVAVCAAPSWAFSESAEDARPAALAAVEAAGKSDAVADTPARRNSAATRENEESDRPAPLGRHVTLDDGAQIPLDGQGLLVAERLGDKYVVKWNGPLTVAEGSKPVGVRLGAAPLVLDLRTGEGVRQALIRVRALRGTTDVHIQAVRAAGGDPIRLEVRTAQPPMPRSGPDESVAERTRLTPAADIEVVSIEGAIPVRLIAVAEGRAESSTAEPSGRSAR